MPGVFITTSDFSGLMVQARNNFTEPVLQSYIDTYEKNFLYKILGKELADLLIASPTNPDYDYIIKAFTYKDSLSCEHQSLGLKFILTALVYYQYQSDQQTQNTITGSTAGNGEITRQVDFQNAYRIGEKKWNEAVFSIEAIQKYVTDNKTVKYPTYNGQEFKIKYSPIL